MLPTSVASAGREKFHSLPPACRPIQHRIQSPQVPRNITRTWDRLGVLPQRALQQDLQAVHRAAGDGGAALAHPGLPQLPDLSGRHRQIIKVRVLHICFCFILS